MERIKIREAIRRCIISEANNKRKASKYLTESKLSSKTIMNVDIQPEYQSYFSFNVDDWIDFLNSNAASNTIVFLYNGEDTLSMISESDYKMWLLEHGLDKDVIYNSEFYDKGYAFFRYCMDNSIDEDNISDLVKFMMRHEINDSRQIDNDMWNKYMKETYHDINDIRDLLENADDMINIPDLMDYLKRHSGIVLLGGGIKECLKEVEIALNSLNKKYEIMSKFTY